MSCRVALIGGQSLVGESVLAALAAAGGVDELSVLAAAPDPAARVLFGARRLRVEDVATFDFGAVDVVLLPRPEEGAGPVVERALAAGCRVVVGGSGDCPEPGVSTGELIAIPGPARLMLQRVIQPLRALGEVEAVDAVALEPAAAGERATVERLARECVEVLNARAPAPPAGEPVRAFNTLLAPREHADDATLAGVPLRLSRVEVPVFFGYAIVAHVAFGAGVTPSSLRETLSAAAGLSVDEVGSGASAREHIDSDSVGVTPVAADADGRVQRLWLVGDDLRLTAAAFCAAVAPGV